MGGGILGGAFFFGLFFFFLAFFFFFGQKKKFFFFFWLFLGFFFFFFGRKKKIFFFFLAEKKNFFFFFGQKKKKKKRPKKNACMMLVRMTGVLPNSYKGWGVCYHVYMTSAHKRTCVDCWNIPNHHTSICSYHVWVCVWMAAMKAIVPRGSACCLRHVTCMLPRELIWEKMAPSHTGMTQSKVIGLGCKMWSSLKSL